MTDPIAELRAAAGRVAARLYRDSSPAAWSAADELLFAVIRVTPPEESAPTEDENRSTYEATVYRRCMHAGLENGQFIDDIETAAIAKPRTVTK